MPTHHKKYYANFGEPVSNPSFGSSPVQPGSYIGIDCSGQEITNFETQIRYDVSAQVPAIIRCFYKLSIWLGR